MASYLITGASRGFGLALARELAALPASDITQIFATARSDSPELKELAEKSSGRVVVVQLDVTNEASVKQAAVQVEAKLAGKGLDVLINNAGVCQYNMDGVKAMDGLTESLTINVLGVHWVTRAFLPLLEKGTLKKVVNIPGLQNLQSGDERFDCSWMKTDLGGGEMADLTAEEGAKASLGMIFRPGQELNGQFPKCLVKGWEKAEGNNQYDGTNSPW
ncbi:MAG: hypothetical protein Q9168_002731 [Polycauliona sp. 1 TL-2023]